MGILRNRSFATPSSLAKLLVIAVACYVTSTQSRLGRALSSASAPRYVKIERWRGRMGNHLFQYMAAVGTAQRMNATYCGSAPYDLDAAFELPVRPLACPHSNFQVWKERGYARYRSTSKWMGNVSMQGFHQSWRYFGTVPVPKVRLRFVSSAARRIQRQGLRPYGFNAIHVRYGDKEGQSWFRFPPCGYFLSARRLFGENLPLVAVAEPSARDFAERLFQSCGLDVLLLDPEEGMVDFATLTLANGIVSTMASTFSWWAAYIGNVRFSYYLDEIVRYHWVNFRKFRASDYYLPRWSALSGLELQTGLSLMNRCVGMYNPLALRSEVWSGDARNHTDVGPLPSTETGSALSSCATFVSAYLRFPSKHSQREYVGWLRRFSKLDINIAMYGNMESLRFFRHLRPLRLEKRTAYYQADFEDFYVRRWHDQWKTTQRNMDPEKDIHGWRLYEMWNEKVMFLEHAMRLNVFDCTYFYWMDAGYVRSQESLELVQSVHPFPSPSHLMDHPKVSLLSVGGSCPWIKPEDKERFPILKRVGTQDCIGGGLFGGRWDHLRVWNDGYLKRIQDRFDSGQFVGKDQDTMTELVQDVSEHVEVWNGFDAHCHNRWFCMIDVLAGKDVYTFRGFR